MSLALLHAVIRKIERLQCNRVRKLFHDNKIDFEQLQNTISCLMDVFTNAERCQFSSQDKLILEKLLDVVYDLDLLLDEALVYSNSRRPSLSKSITRQFIDIMTRFDALADETHMLPQQDVLFKHEKTVRSRKQTWSYVDKMDIIGREEDKETVVGMLLSHSYYSNSNPCFVTILGTGGVGKTALAQLIFNDEKIESHFVLRFWLCLAENTSLKAVLCKLYRCLDERVWYWEDEVTLEMLVKQIRETIQRKRYLLVLDDVSCNAKIWWDHLGDIFSDGDKGSRILVTTRSIMVAKIISNNCIYELNGLSDKDSLELFKTLAFSSDQDIDVELLHIAKDLTQKCANLPLTIKVIASLVYGHKKGMWVSLLGHDFPELPQVKEKLRHIDESDDKRRSIQTIEETFSYVKEERIIGREADKEAVVGMLLSDDATEDHVSFISIVGMAGVGKTALAQLVFHDDRIKCGFELRFWVCVSDNPNDLGVKTLFHKILEQCLQDPVGESSLPIDILKSKVAEKIKGKRVLLVLDGVWCEDSELWNMFKMILLLSGGEGSKILITSRSKIVSTVTASRYTHELDGLSEDHFWELFKKSAFQTGELYLQESDDELRHIRREITQLCSGVPLIIRVIGSVLCNEDKRVLLQLKTTDLVELSQVKEHVMPALRLSYDHLDSTLKQCFGFCSIFPKNYVIQKEVLISLWLAQGYLGEEWDDRDDRDDTGEDYCFRLLSRYFFKDIQRNEFGEVMSFEMDHLTHDLAQQVAGSEFLMLPVVNSNFPRVKIRHLSISENAGSYEDLFNPSILLSEKLQTIFNLKGYALCSPEDVATVISVRRHLKLLDLQNLALRTLPVTFDNVPHLRYLDLSDNEELEILPVSITRLHNLRVLRLRGCKNLKELPDDLGNLTNLVHLDIVGCNRLTCMPCMPVGFDKLIRLTRLTMFVVSGDDSNRVNSGRLINSKANRFGKLRGELLIKVVQFSPSNMQNVIEGACIVKDAQLQALEIMYADGSSEAGKVHEALLEKFHPNKDLERIIIHGYQGTKLPSWALAMATYVPNLVIIKLSHFRGLQHLTTLSQLCHLKYLHLRKMWNVESIETDSPFALPSTSTNSMVFFPALEKLVLDWMPNLKRWWRDLKWVKMEAGSGCLVDGNDVHMEQLILPLFPCLRDLSIYRCPSLTYFPPCPLVKSLDLRGINEEMTFCTKGGDPILCLEKLSLYYNTKVFQSVVGDFAVPGTADIDLKYFYKEKSLGIAREVFERCASSLRNLSIDGFYKLESLTAGGIECLINLQSLSIEDCPKLDFIKLEQEEMPWESLQSLSSLTFDRIPKMVNLPKGLEHLTSLQSLHIRRCNNLKDIGDCLCKLTSLQALHIEDCYNLNPLPDYISCRTPQLKLDVKNCPQLESV